MTIMLGLVLLLSHQNRVLMHENQQIQQGYEQEIDSLRAINDTLGHELRFFRRYVRPDSAWVAEQVMYHGIRGEEANRMVRAFIVYGMATGISPRVLAATGRVESAFRKNAVSTAGAHGLMQVVPYYWWNMYRDQCGEWNPYNARKSICYGAHIIRYELDRRGTLPDALSAYNSGYPADRSSQGRRYADRVAAFVGADS